MKEDGRYRDSSWTPVHLCVMHRDDGEQLTVISSPTHQEGRGQPIRAHMHAHVHTHTDTKVEQRTVERIKGKS